MLGNIEGERRQKKMRWLNSWARQEEEDEMDTNLSKLWEIVEDRGLACYSPWDWKESDTT